MNTMLEYLYRDASNHKTRTATVVRGSITEEQKKVIMDALTGDNLFIPEQVGLPANRFDEVTEDDHCFCELYLQDITLSDRTPTVDMDTEDLVESFRKAGREGWDCIKYAPFF